MVDIGPLLHRRVAQTCIGASSMRNQGAPGVVEAARNYLEHEVELGAFVIAMAAEQAYRRFLDRHTQRMVARLPKGGRSWGAARKGLNLFFRDVCYNTMLAHTLGLPRSARALDKAMRWMEVPLDKDVAMALRRECGELPPWPSIRKLDPGTSAVYQAAAKGLAMDYGVSRIQLDLIFWREA